MCGITGIWNLNHKPINKPMLERFTDSLTHRGPDGNGFHIDSGANLGFGHRRLSIIDTTETGHQPMSYARGRYWITFNGEIYNFLELREELKKDGYQFFTESDTEVVLAAYDRWGEECQQRFNGMWAFAIWDKKKKKLFISRDRFGIKPLLYFSDKKHFAFASEMKAFLSLNWFSLEFDEGMVTTSLLDSKLIEGTEQTLLKNLHRLLGGYCLTLQQDKGLKIRRWWNTLDHLETVPTLYEDQVERYRELFLDSCRIRMRSDVPIGTALSGGLDSSSVISGMRYIHDKENTGERLASQWQNAFVATYPQGSVIDERVYADQVIERTGAKPFYCKITPDMYLDNFEKILFQYEEISDIHLGPWLVYKTQRENGIVVTLDGHGGDEALGGYPWYITSEIQESLKEFSIKKTLTLVETMKDLEIFPRDQFYKKSIQSLAQKYRDKKKKDFWLLQGPRRFYSPAYEEDKKRLENQNALFKRLYIDFHFTHLPMVLRNFDRISMAHGVEVRSPLMDWRLITYSFSLPSESKIGKGYTKRILRDAMKGLLPEDIRLRKGKLGFPNMKEAWSSPRAKEFILDTVQSRKFQESSVWKGEKIQEDVEKAVSDKDNPKIQKAWKFTQAFYLMEYFQKERSSIKQSEGFSS